MTLPDVTVNQIDGAQGLAAPSTRSTLNLGVSSAGSLTTLYGFVRGKDAVATLGDGPLVESLCEKLETAGGPQYAIRLNGSIAGANSAVTKTGSSLADMTLSGAPLDDYDGIAEILTGGERADMRFRYSLDGGESYSETIAGAATYAIPRSGITLNWGVDAATDYVAGTTYTWTSSAPQSDADDIDDAFDVIVANDFATRMCHLVGLWTDAAEAATICAAFESAISNLELNHGLYMRGIMDSAEVSDALLTAGFAAVLAPHVGVGGGMVKLASAVFKKRVYKRPIGWVAASRQARILLRKVKRDLSTHLGRVRDGALPANVRSILRDERLTPALDTARFITARTIVRKRGFFLTRGQTMAQTGSDFSPLQNGLVLDRQCEVTRAVLVEELNDDLRANSDGTLFELEARRIEKQLEGKLRDALFATENVSAPPTAVMDRTVKVTPPDRRLVADTRSLPKGYAEEISASVGFSTLETVEEEET